MAWNKCRAEFWTNYHAVFCNRFRILTASFLSAHFFWFLLRGFKKLTWIGSRVSEKHWVSETYHFEWVFWSPWAKIEKSEPIRRKLWEFWTDCKKTHGNRFKTLPYICSEPQKNSKTVFLCFWCPWVKIEKKTFFESFSFTILHKTKKIFMFLNLIIKNLPLKGYGPLKFGGPFRWTQSGKI